MIDHQSRRAGCAGRDRDRPAQPAPRRSRRARESNQALQQQLELPHLTLDVEGAVQAVEDRDGQSAVVAIALEQADDAAVFDLALADADLELAGAYARIAQVDALHVGVNGVIV